MLATIASVTLAAAETSSPLAGGPIDASAVLRLAFGLAAIIALLLACAWVARRCGFAPRSQPGAHLQLVSSLSISPREKVIVVSLEKTWLVLGVSAGGIRTLHTLEAPSAQLSESAKSASPWAVPSLGFASLLRDRFRSSP